MDTEIRYVAADISPDLRKRVQDIARAEKTTRAVMLGRLAALGVAEYERRQKSAKLKAQS